MSCDTVGDTIGGITSIYSRVGNFAIRTAMVNVGRRLNHQLVNPATVRFQSASIDFGKFGFSAIKHPPLEAMRYSMFAIPHHESFMSATDYDKLLAGLTRVSFAEKETGVVDDRQRYEATTANFETMWMGWHDVGDKLHRYVVKRYPKEKWYLLQRDIASVYCAVALGVGEFAVKSHYYIRGEDAYFVRRFIRGVDGLHAINDPQKYSPAFVSNDALASLFVAYRVLKGDPDAGNPRNVVLADNSKVGFEMAGTSKGPSLVMVDNETTFANNQLFLDRVVPMMGIQWKPNDPFFGSVGWRHSEVQLVGAAKFIDWQLSLEDPLLYLLKSRLGPAIADYELPRPALEKMVNSFGDVLKYLNYFKVYTQQEIASSDLPIRVATQCLYNALNSGKKLTLGDAITGFYQYR